MQDMFFELFELHIYTLKLLFRSKMRFGFSHLHMRSPCYKKKFSHLLYLNMVNNMVNNNFQKYEKFLKSMRDHNLFPIPHYIY